MKKWFTLCFLVISTSVCLGQNDSTFRFHGKVIEKGTFRPLSFASILVVNKRKGTASKSDGGFSFQVNIGDEIRITSVGFEPWFYTISEVDREDKRPYMVQMEEKVYELEDVEISELSDNFYLKRPPRDTLKIANPFLNTENPTDWSKSQIVPLENGQAGFAITGIFNSFDRQLQQKKKLKELREAERFIKERKTEREKYFNKEMVRRITRIDERVIDEFMEYCAFLDGEIIGKSEYEITLKVLQRYKSFLRR